MSLRNALLEKVRLEQIIGVVREDHADIGEAVADAYARNGVRIIEITLTTPEAFELIAKLAARYADAGCMAVNLGASLAVPDLVRTAQWEEIGRRALLATSIIQSRRDMVAPETYVH